jgi:hypothetical protein
MVLTAQTALLSLPQPAELSIANSEAQLVSINGAPYAGPAQVSGTVTLDLPTPGLYWVAVNVDGQVASFQLIRPAL